MKRLNRLIDEWLFERCDPVLCSWLRIAGGLLLCVYFAMFWREAELWFSDAGLLQASTMQQLATYPQPSLLYWLPTDPTTVQTCLLICVLQAALLTAGVWSRFQAACLFVWLVSFQHRNGLICDGQDVLLRLFTFYWIFMPCDYRLSLGRWWRNRWRGVATPQSEPSAWALRLVQFQLTAIYLSTAWEKFQGVTWRDGTALFYVARMDDLYGRWALPDVWFETPWILAAMTWGVLALEAALPALLWYPPTRKWGVLAAALLHLSIEITMHIFLFEWLMLICLLAFVDRRWLTQIQHKPIAFEPTL